MPEKGEWFRDEKFWEHFAPIMFDESRWNEVPDLVSGIIRLAGESLSRERLDKFNVLDMCCGFGRVSAEFARRGFHVTGVDITESYLQTAREDAAYENLNIEYVNADARDFVRPCFFDIALNLYISFGYFENQEDDLKLARNIYESLKKGGSFIIETLGKEIAVRDFVESEWFERAGYKVLTAYEAEDAWTFLKNRWIIVKDGEMREKTFSQRLYSASELRSLLLEAGFEKVEIYGDWDLNPYNINAVKMIVVGRK